MSKKILIIEDDRSFAKLAEYTLGHAGYEVLIAYDGFDGLSKAIQELPHLIIVDTMLPGIDGNEVCHWLRTNVATSLIPVIAVSSKIRMETDETALNYNADYYLEKPIEPSLMIDAAAFLIAGIEKIDGCQPWLVHNQVAAYAC